MRASLAARILALALAATAPVLRAQDAGVVPGQWLVQLRPEPGLSAEGLLRAWVAREPALARWHPVAPALGVYRLEETPAAAWSGAAAGANGSAPWPSWTAALSREPAVLALQPNHRLQRREIPSDPSFNLQWGLFNDGGAGTAGADIDATEAWDITTGGVTALGDTIVIAVVDDGFDLAHEDLWFWTNRSEIPGDTLDNDGNGYIDDVVGWNAVTDTSALPVAFHGTHVCGIAAARGNNGIGVTGVTWSTPVLPVYSTLEEDDVVAAYGYVHAMRRLYDTSGGARGAFVVVVNSSFGIDFAQPEDYPIWCAMYDSLGALGILSPAATINALLDVDAIGDVPTACASDFLVAVTNTDDDDELRSAGYGRTQIDLGAPGTGVYSTIPGSNYGFNTGTSMATPHVAGTVALMMAAACERFAADYRLDPPGMARLLKHYLLAGAEPIPDLVDRTVSGGRLNVRRALDSLLIDYCGVSGLGGGWGPSAESAWRAWPNPSGGAWTIERPPAGGGAGMGGGFTGTAFGAASGETLLPLFDALGRPVATLRWPAGTTRLRWDPGALPPGAYWLRDAEGRALPLWRR